MKPDDPRSDPSRRILVLKGRTVQAAYRDTGIPGYNGNPLIEALPPVLTDEQATLRLAHYPQYDEAHRRAPGHIRYHGFQGSRSITETVMTNDRRP